MTFLVKVSSIPKKKPLIWRAMIRAFLSLSSYFFNLENVFRKTTIAAVVNGFAHHLVFASMKGITAEAYATLTKASAALGSIMLRKFSFEMEKNFLSKSTSAD